MGRGARCADARPAQPPHSVQRQAGIAASIPRRVIALMRRYIGRPAGFVLPALTLAGCGMFDNMVDSGPAEGNVGYVSGFLGGVAADEPHAALAARDVLSAGGTAADAAVAAAFMMSVTLPSRVGLMGGGACLAYGAGHAEADAIVFPAGRPVGTGGGDRPAAVPLLARGLFALHARHGRRPFESLLAPAEQAARFGTRVSRALARDLAPVATPLFADPQIRAVFAGSNGAPLTEGAMLTQVLLSTTLAQLRVAGVGDMYNGTLAQRIASAAPQAGASLTVPELRAALPRVVQAVTVPAGNDIAAFLPPPADPAGATAAAFQGGNVGSVGGALPASATVVTLDRDGNSVACAFSMNNLWGTGRMLPGTGMIAAAAPDTGAVRAPVLAAGLAFNANRRAFRAVAAGSGQGGAPAAAAAALRAAIAGQAPTVADPGRFNAIGCPGLVPGREATCRWFTDPRGSGLAAGAD